MFRATFAALILATIGAPGAHAAIYANATPITIPDPGNASPYGSSIPVAGMPGLVSRVGVELIGVHHEFAADLRVLLVGPAGTAWVLNRQGGLNDLNAGNLRIDSDSTAKNFSDTVEPGVHAIEPERDPGASPMPAPAPQSVYGASLRPLLGGAPNGNWTLYVRDESAGSAGSIPGGWRLHLDTTVNDRLDRLDLDGVPAGIESAIVGVHLYRKKARAPLGALDVRVRSVDGTAKAGEDFVAVNQTVHFDSGSEEAVLPVQLINNAVVEGPETFGIEFVDLPTGVAPPTDPLDPITIVDNDGPAGLYARFPSTPVSIGEGRPSPDPLHVVRTGASVTDPLQLTWEVLGGTASAADVDLPAPAPLPQQRFITLLVPTAADDADDEAPVETTNFFLKVNGNFVTAAALRVLDNEGPGVMSVRVGELATELDATKGSVFVQREGGSFSITEAATVTIAPGTALQNVDYSPAGGTTTRDATLHSNTVGQGVPLNLGVSIDGQQEGTEEVRVTLSSSTAVVDPTRAAVNVPVLDGTFPFGYGGEIAPATTASPSTEGTIIRIPVHRVGPPNTAVSAHWSTRDVTALAGRDYQAASGTVSWPAFDDTDREIQVTTLQDSLVEGEERVGVTLDTPTISDPSATIGLSPAAVEGRITDDDTTGPGQFEIDSAALSVAEGQPIVVPVHRRLGQAGAVAVTCSVADGGGTATPGADLAASATATFANAAREGTCTLPTTADALDEPNESLKIELTAPTGGAVVGPASTRNATITDDDPPGSGPIRFTGSEVTVAESAGSVPITIDRGPGTTGDVNALVTLRPGTAGPGEATLPTQRVTIPAGQTSANVALTVVDDGDDEALDTEDVTVVLSDPQGGVSLGEPSTQRIVITDDDSGKSASIVNGGRALKVLEKAGRARLVVRRQSGVPDGAGFSWSVVLGTAGRNDVTVRAGRAVFAAGSQDATIDVPIADDRRVERNETFRVIIADPVGSLTLSAPTSRAVTILDNDGFAAIRVRTRRAQIDRRNRAPVRLACPKAARRPCAGRLILAIGKGKNAVTLGSVRYSVKPRRAKTVAVPLGAEALALLAPKGRTTVVLRARATSKAVRAVTRTLVLLR
jgi:subtilisin-like proprotein convertase family protein